MKNVRGLATSASALVLLVVGILSYSVTTNFSLCNYMSHIGKADLFGIAARFIDHKLKQSSDWPSLRYSFWMDSKLVDRGDGEIVYIVDAYIGTHAINTSDQSYDTTIFVNGCVAVVQPSDVIVTVHRGDAMER